MSHLTRGAWIEISNMRQKLSGTSTSHLTRGAWIEIPLLPRELLSVSCRTSHEVRGLKYRNQRGSNLRSTVAPHTRCVD